MEKMTSKVRVREILEQAKQSWEQQGQDALLVVIYEGLLKKKVSFPLLEFAAKEMALWIPEDEQLYVMDILVATKEMGSYVLAGMMLQLRLPLYLEESIQRACAYIVGGDQWYVCDIVGERVLGHALLTYPEKNNPFIETLGPIFRQMDCAYDRCCDTLCGKERPLTKICRNYVQAFTFAI